MDRFIGMLTLSALQQMKYLKSNMDRFIAWTVSFFMMLSSNLKSNMDRFIGTQHDRPMAKR